MLADLSDPERQLALSYAPSSKRAALAALWRFDEKLGAIVASTSDVAIGEMRLLWWREAVDALPNEVRSEPLLQELAPVVAASGVASEVWGGLSEGWFTLLGEPLEPEDLENFASKRGETLFALSAQLLGGEHGLPIGNAGRAWALADLGHRLQDESLAARARGMAEVELSGAPQRWPRNLRPLGALAKLVHRDARSAMRHVGSPSRVARMAWHRISGF